jgi:uncharacterized protein (TIGR00297 family)
VETFVPRLIAGGFLSAAVACIARRYAALTVSGAWAAAVVGTLLVLAGWPWLALAGVFFVTSSALTLLEPAQRDGARSSDRAGRRWQQVAANGGVAALTAALSAATGWPQGFGVAAGAIAAATADTWATELGRWSRTPPRLITTGTPVAAGVSGGVTPAGTAGSVAGALLIAALALALSSLQMRTAGAASSSRIAWTAWIAAAGVTGSLLDSLLGATLEGRWRWLDNDAVNVAATTWGAAVILYVTTRGGLGLR